MTEWKLEREGFCIVPRGISREKIEHLKDICSQIFANDAAGVRARSSRGHVYAARNLIGSIPEVTTVWQSNPLLKFLSDQLGADFGLVRALFFDKPPERTWALAWHKDTSIAVIDNSIESSAFSRPTTKADVPHVIANDEILRRMLTLRIHLDEVDDENGPLLVVPKSHFSNHCEGAGTDNAVAIHAGIGDVLAMRPLITHGSGASHAGTRRHRRILHLEFAADRQLPDGYSWHDFVTASKTT